MTSTKNVTYRVIVTTVNDFLSDDDSVSESIFWEGIDTDQLSRDYPPSEIFGADKLDHREIEDGYIRTDFRFERQTGDGSWEACDDPRRRITPMTAMERAIDAENRRDFPGDYI